VALLFCLVLCLYSSLVLSNIKILGGETSVWDINSVGSPYGLYVSNATLYDPSFATFTGDPLVGAFGVVVIDDLQEYYAESGFYDQPDPSGSFIGTSYLFANFNYTKQFYVSPTLPVVRFIATFTAISDPIAATVKILSEILDPGSQNFLFGEESGNNILDTSDLWYVTGLPYINSASHEISSPFITWSIFGPGATTTENSLIIDQESNYTVTIANIFKLNLQPGESQSLLFFAELSNTVDNAVAAASKYVNIAELQSTDLLFGLSDDDLNNIVNWGLQQPRKVSSYTGICDFANEIKDRVSKLRPNERHSFTQPWRC